MSGGKIEIHAQVAERSVALQFRGEKAMRADHRLVSTLRYPSEKAEAWPVAIGVAPVPPDWR